MRLFVVELTNKKISTMNALKYIGVLALIIGVLMLAIPFLTIGTVSNTILASGIVLVIGGYLVHIFLNKKFE